MQMSSTMLFPLPVVSSSDPIPFRHYFASFPLPSTNFRRLMSDERPYSVAISSLRQTCLLSIFRVLSLVTYIRGAGDSIYSHAKW